MNTKKILTNIFLILTLTPAIPDVTQNAPAQIQTVPEPVWDNLVQPSINPITPLMDIFHPQAKLIYNKPVISTTTYTTNPIQSNIHISDPPLDETTKKPASTYDA